MRVPASLLVALLVGCGDKSDADTAAPETVPDDTGADTDTDTPTDPDADGDGYLRSVDCDDTNADVRPDADEVCNGIDDNCDGRIDDDDPDLSVDGALLRHPDTDGDGFGDPTEEGWVCQEQDGLVEDDTDCDDTRAEVFPGAVEVCNGIDDDCDTLTDDDDVNIDLNTAQTFYADTDGDRYGDPDVTDEACQPPTGYVADSQDCDDQDAQVNPLGQEVCDGIDNDCDDQIDDADESLDPTTTTTWYPDDDGDGYGQASPAARTCTAPSGTVADRTDCDDTEATTHPGATEHCDDVDSDCDAATTEDGIITRSGTSYSDLATALAAARRGDDVVMCDGTYAGEVSVAVAVTIRSLHGADLTTLTGSGTDAVLTVAAAVTVEGLTITGGDASDGGGIDAYTASAGDLTVRDCVLEDNAATYGGAISGPAGHDLLVYDTVIRGNTATLLGGGIYMVDGTLEGVLLEDNTALNGGGLYVDTGRVTLDADTILQDNTGAGSSGSVGAGGGLLANEAVLFLDPDTLITGNTAEYGGGMYLIDTTLRDGGRIDSNEATEEGGGIFLSGDLDTLQDAVITGNTAIYGGGISADAANIKLQDLVITDNIADDYGGGMFVYTTTTGTLIGTEVSGNTADYGGGIMTYSATMTMSTASFLSNSATYSGGGLYGYDSTVNLDTCDIEDNLAGSVGGGAALEDSTLKSTTSDWGVSTTDNAPDDVYIWDIRAAYSSFGGSASFTCLSGTLGCR